MCHPGKEEKALLLPPPSSSPPTPGTKNLLVGAAHKILSITRRCRSGHGFNIFLPLLLLPREPTRKLFIIFSCDRRRRRPSALFRSGIIRMAKRRRLLLFCRTLPPTIFPSNIKVVDPHSNDDDRASHPSQRVVRSRAPIPSHPNPVFAGFDRPSTFTLVMVY